MYVVCRPRQPLLFTALGFARAPFVSECRGFEIHQWLPTLAHVAAFSFATCALLSARPRSAVVAAANWTVANLLWELRGMSGAGVDLADAAAAILGFAVAICATLWLQSLSHRVA
jgi:hypothetical protein